MTTGPAIQGRQEATMFSGDDFNGHRVKQVRIDRIDIPEYQRVRMEGWASDIAQNWNNYLFTYPRLSAKEGGRFDCIDGQHTILAAEKRGHTELPCAVLDGVDTKTAAGIFSDINTGRRRLTSFDVYKADLYAGREWAVTLHDIAQRYGVNVARGASPYTLQAIGQAKSIIDGGGAEHLEHALAILTMAYDPDLPENSSRLERKLVVGCVDLVRRAKREGLFERQLFINKLRSAKYKRRAVSGLKVTPESIETDYIPAMIEQGNLQMPPLNSAMGNAVLFGRALAIAIFGVDKARHLYS